MFSNVMQQKSNISKETINDFLNKKNVIAVVGVSRDEKKYGYQVFFDLLKKGYQVFPIHPQGGKIKKYQRYKNLAELPQKPDVVTLVVPPQISLKIAKECYRLKIKKVWLQPGAENQEVLDYCQHHNLETLSGVCIIKQSF